MDTTATRTPAIVTWDVDYGFNRPDGTRGAATLHVAADTAEQAAHGATVALQDYLPAFEVTATRQGECGLYFL